MVQAVSSIEEETLQRIFNMGCVMVRSSLLAVGCMLEHNDFSLVDAVDVINDLNIPMQFLVHPPQVEVPDNQESALTILFSIFESHLLPGNAFSIHPEQGCLHLSLLQLVTDTTERSLPNLGEQDDPASEASPAASFR